MKALSLVISLLILTACGNPEDFAIELQFTEQEAGIAPYKTRLLITPDFLRIDDGSDSKDFILFDRKAEKISSVGHDNSSILEISHRKTHLKNPANLTWQHEIVEAKNAPTINNIQPTGHRFKVNQQTCLQIMAAKGLLERARLAMIEYETVLASEHAANFEKTPKDQRDACKTALSIFYATDSLKYGFPIIEWDSSGYRRQLDNFTEDTTFKTELFQLPIDFHTFSLDN